MRKNIIFTLIFAAIQVVAWCISLLFEQSQVAFVFVSIHLTMFFWCMWIIWELEHIKSNQTYINTLNYDVLYQVKEDVYKFKAGEVLALKSIDKAIDGYIVIDTQKGVFISEYKNGEYQVADHTIKEEEIVNIYKIINLK